MKALWGPVKPRTAPVLDLPPVEASRAVYGLLRGDQADPWEGYLTTIYKQTLGEVNDRAADLARQQAGSLVTGLKAQDQRALARLMEQALDLGWSDAQIERRVAQIVGLGPRYAQALDNYRNGLVAKQLPAAQVAKQVREYSKRLRAHRASTIARTEIQKALNEAQLEIWKERQDLGELTPYAVAVFRVHKDERLCKVCRPLNGKRVSLKKVAKFAPPVHPNCRCFWELSDEGISKDYLRINGFSQTVLGEGGHLLYPEGAADQYMEYLDPTDTTHRNTVGGGYELVGDGENVYAREYAEAVPTVSLPMLQALLQRLLDMLGRQTVTPPLHTGLGPSFKYRGLVVKHMNVGDPGYRAEHPNSRRGGRRMKPAATTAPMPSGPATRAVPSQPKVDRRKVQGQTARSILNPLTGKPYPNPTEPGDTGEALFAKKGARMVARALKVKGYEQNAGVKRARNTPLDFIFGTKKDDPRYAAEVKSTSARASGGKPKSGIKKDEYTRKVGAIDLDDEMNPDLPRAQPLLIGQLIDQRPDGSGSVKVVMFVGDYPSKGYHLMQVVGSYEYTRQEWLDAWEEGRVNRQRKGVAKYAR